MVDTVSERHGWSKHEVGNALRFFGACPAGPGCSAWEHDTYVKETTAPVAGSQPDAYFITGLMSSSGIGSSSQVDECLARRVGPRSSYHRRSRSSLESPRIRLQM